MFGLFKKKDYDYFGDLGKSVNNLVDKQIDTDFYKNDNRFQIESDTNKIKLLISETPVKNVYSEWYKREVNAVIKEKEYLKIHTMSAIIATFTYIGDHPILCKIPNELKSQSSMELFYNTYIACLNLRDLKPGSTLDGEDEKEK